MRFILCPKLERPIYLQMIHSHSLNLTRSFNKVKMHASVRIFGLEIFQVLPVIFSSYLAFLRNYLRILCELVLKRLALAPLNTSADYERTEQFLQLLEIVTQYF